MKVSGDDLKNFLADHGFNREELDRLNFLSKTTSQLSLEPSERAAFRWRSSQEAWVAEIRYRQPKDQRAKIYVPIGYTSPVLVAAIQRLAEESEATL